MTTGDILACRLLIKPRTIQGYAEWVIQQNCGYKHTATYYNIEGEEKVIEASIGKGVIITPYQDWLDNRYKNGEEIHLYGYEGKVDFSDFIAKVNLAEGKDYDVVGAGYFQAKYQLIKKIFHRVKWFGFRGDLAAKKFYCSELCFWLLNIDGWESADTGTVRDHYLFEYKGQV
jgi:hypothetical protein